MTVMCLAMPARVVQLIDDDRAVIELGGVQKTISTLLVDDVKIGDYVIIHVGYALSKLDELEAQKTLRLFQDVVK
jgi:hydrogenase expression/formation protein HypC